MEKRLESNDANFLRLKNYEEIVGKLIAIHLNGIIVEIHGRPIKVSMSHQTARKLRRFLGQRIAILRTEHRYHVRAISGRRALKMSATETPFQHDCWPKKTQHFHDRQVLRCREIVRKSGGVSFGGQKSKGCFRCVGDLEIVMHLRSFMTIIAGWEFVT